MKQLIKKCSIAAIVALGITLSPGALRTTPEGQPEYALLLHGWRADGWNWFDGTC